MVSLKPSVLKFKNFTVQVNKSVFKFKTVVFKLKSNVQVQKNQIPTWKLRLSHPASVDPDAYVVIHVPAEQFSGTPPVALATKCRVQLKRHRYVRVSGYKHLRVCRVYNEQSKTCRPAPSPAGRPCSSRSAAHLRSPGVK